MESVTQSRTMTELSPSQVQQIRYHLEEVLASPAFANSKRAQDFLHLVVGHALEGDYESLRERMIGAEMFGRPVDYDTGSDSVVRVKATEVRKKLQQFYLESPSTSVRIDLPSGSYVPKFSFSVAEAAEPVAIHAASATVDPQWPTEQSTGVTVQEAPSPRRPDWRRVLGGVRGWPVLWVVLALLALSAALGVRRYLLTMDAVPIHSIAILPMENFSGVPSQDYFADGMTDELVSDLGQATGLPVKPIAAVISYKESRKSAADAGRELGVDGVVQASFMHEGSRVLIYVWFTAVKTNHVIWFHSYVRDFRTAESWQGELSHAIVTEISHAVTPEAQAKYGRGRSVDPVAQDLFLHGKYLLEAEDCSNAADYFRAALNIDFNYPQAQAELAFCDGHLGETDRVDSVDAFLNQKIEATRASELDNSLAEGHAELANAEINLNWDWAAAGAELRQAIALNRTSGSIHEEYERYLVRTGQIRETRAEVEKYEDLEPFSSRLYHLEGIILYYCRQYDQAKLLVEKVRTLDVPPPNWHMLLGEIDAEKGDYADSITEFLHAGTRPQALGHLGNVYARAGRVDEATEIISQLEDAVKNEGVGRYEIALVYAGLGRKTEAFKWLEESYRTHDEGITYIKVEPCLDPLRSDPRFDDLLSRVGLSQ
jgi:TolB-like protein/Flp pilus assembly protein TadD